MKSIWSRRGKKPDRSYQTLILTVLLLGVSFTAGAEGVRSGTLPRGMESFDTVFPRLMREWGIPGGAVVLAKDGRLLLARGYGYANQDKRVPVDPWKHAFRLASLSKAITAAAILKLVESGRLKLDAPVFSLLPWVKSAELQVADPRLRQVTVRHLLHHSGGWDAAQGYDPMFATRVIAEARKTSCPPSIRDIVHYMLTQSLSFDPGTAYAYSNFG
ncbi:MAG TPA: serine hydrolase domain-containing protein, partial [Candidatus Ozemobacteraceae bacterium]|nr:serine hydrolase domain-containing protein [Candidatus Ozemobacteraceae bacterium]